MNAAERLTVRAILAAAKFYIPPADYNHFSSAWRGEVERAILFKADEADQGGAQLLERVYQSAMNVESQTSE